MSYQPLKTGTQLFQRFDDWINPIVVKELRQAVQGKFVVGIFIFLLIVQLAAVGIFLVASGDLSTTFDAGRDLFMMLQGVLLGACMLFVPGYAAFRLASERSGVNVDLLFITTLGPRAIIGGKLLAGLILTALILSACLPFMVFTYFLRGIDLPSIFILLLLDVLVVAVSIQLAMFITSMPLHKVFKVLFGIQGLWMLIMLFSVTMASSYELLRSGVGSFAGGLRFWGLAGAVVLVGFSVIGLLFFLSVALITPTPANRALPVRTYLTIVWLVTGVVAAIWSFSEKIDPPIIIWLVMNTALACLAFFAAVSEREHLGRRVTRTIPRGGAKRFLSFFFYSGAASGVAWSCLMIGLTLVMAWGWAQMFPAYRDHDDLLESLAVMTGMGLYAFCYAMSGRLVRRWFLGNRINQKYTWLVALILLLLGSLIPLLIAFFLLFDQWDIESAGMWLMGNPFALFIKDYRPFHLAFAGAWAVVFAILNLSWFISQWDNFRPDRPPAVNFQPSALTSRAGMDG